MNQNSRIPSSTGFTSNPEMARQIAQNPTFRNIQDNVHYKRDSQRMKYNYTYHLSGTVTGQQTAPFEIIIEQGTDFRSLWLTGKLFSYDAANATSFPVPNSLGSTAWAGSGLEAQITDTRSGRNLTNGFLQLEDLITPGYGTNFQHPYPFKYYWSANTIIRFDIRNRDNASRDHDFSLALNGEKIEQP